MKYHVPVLLNEVVAYLHPEPGQVIADCTAGTGGHSMEIAEKVSPSGRVIMIDVDEEALKIAEKRLSDFPNIHIFAESYTRLPEILNHLGLPGVDGLLYDFGVSSLQLDRAERGFSFSRSGPLDMRMNPTEDTLTAYTVVNEWPEEKLREIIQRYSDERRAGRIAARIVSTRQEAPIRDTGELARIICKASGPGRQRIHPATRTFQAIRIAVNREKENVTRALETGFPVLKKSGCLTALSFHSMEDRIVKTFMRKTASEGKAEILTRKPVRPSEAEIQTNPRSRSVKLRALRKQ